LKGLLDVSMIGGFKNIMKNVQMIANNLFLLYNEYAAQGLFAIGSSHKIVIFPLPKPKAPLTLPELFAKYKSKSKIKDESESGSGSGSVHDVINTDELAKMLQEQKELNVIMRNRFTGNIQSRLQYEENAATIIEDFIKDTRENVSNKERDGDSWLYELTEDQYFKLMHYLYSSKRYKPDSQGSMYAVGGKKTRRKQRALRIKKDTRDKKRCTCKKGTRRKKRSVCKKHYRRSIKR